MSLPVNFMTMTIFALDVSMARTQTKWKQEVWVLYVDTTWKYYSWTAGRHCVYNYKNLLIMLQYPEMHGAGDRPMNWDFKED